MSIVKFSTLTAWIFCLAGVFTLSTSTMISAQTAGSVMDDARASLFREADQAMLAAQQVQAEMLAPKNYGAALNYYQEANAQFKKGRSLDMIRQDLRSATNAFRKAADATKLAAVTFTTTIAARKDAISAGANRYGTKQWIAAEREFADAAGELEDGDVNNARKKARKAEDMYRAVELEAIKTNFLSEAQSLIRQAEQADAKKEAPKTLQQAQTLVRQAEQKLAENRYDTDEARSLARQAKYTAQRLVYLTTTVKQLKRDNKSLEDIIIAAEQPIHQIAGAANVVASFENGVENTTSEIISQVRTYQNRIQRLDGELSSRGGEMGSLQSNIANLEQQIQQLKAENDKKVMGLETEKTRLLKQIRAEDSIRAMFAKVERIFTPDEASVFRQEQNVLIRLHGLNFSVGKSTIEPNYFSLLTKAQQAIKTFPGSRVTVEGHTDSFGGDKTNQDISEARANAVREYLIANMALTPEEIKAVGFGERKPIASNETTEGRTKNRRIDIVIHPKF